MVAVIPVPFTGFYAAAGVVSGDTRTLTFSGLSLVPGSWYQAVVWAYDKPQLRLGDGSSGRPPRGAYCCNPRRCRPRPSIGVYRAEVPSVAVIRGPLP